MAGFLDAALDYVSRGWAVFPLTPRAKVPTAGSRGFKDATTNIEQIRRWWAETPNANVGVATGQVSGLLVVDIDPGHGGEESFERLEIEHGRLPVTCECVTGSGGRHLYYAAPPARLRNKTGLAGYDGIDIRADGGYVVAPPSVHPSGGAYGWVAEQEPAFLAPVTAPDHLVALIAPKAPTVNPQPTARRAPPTSALMRYGSGALDRAVDTMRSAHRGKRHDVLLAQAIAMGELVASDALTETEAVGGLRDAALAAGLPEREAASTAQYGVTVGQRSPRDLSGVGLDAPPGPGKDAAGAPVMRAPVEMGEGKTPGDLPEIQANKRFLGDVVDDAWRAVSATGDHCGLFLRSSRLVRIIGTGTETDPTRLVEVDRDTMVGLLKHAARWVVERKTRQGTVFEPAEPLVSAARDMIALPNPALPPCDAVVNSPIFATDGRLLCTTGHYPDEALWLECGIEIDVPHSPTLDDVTAARRLLLDELLGDFPWKEEADRINALSLVLLPFVRRMIRGVTPLHLVASTTARSGKSLLVWLVHMIATGRGSSPLPFERDNSETRKLLHAEMAAAARFVAFDNLARGQTVLSPDLARVLTSEYPKDRTLGVSQTAAFPNRAIWTMTGNNVGLDTDTANRCVPIMLYPQIEKPESRAPSSFRHWPLDEWTRENRPALVSAALTLVQSWVRQGARPGSLTLGGFESYTRTMSGILANAGAHGFMSNRQQLLDEADTEGTRWRSFVAYWWGECGSHPLTATELAKVAERQDGDMATWAGVGDKSDRSVQSKIGRALSGQAGRVFGGRRIDRARDAANRTTYRLIEVA